ncbi:MAG: hemerythrin domain-containing protein [Vicinamibacteria bacterium]
MTTIFEMLQSDHQEVQNAIRNMLSEENAQRRQKLCQELQNDLFLHMTFEEDTFYPEARRATQMNDEIEDDLREHEEARQLLSEVASADPSSTEWEESVEELQQALAHHIEDEEEKLFPAMREETSEDEAKDLAEKYQTFKRSRERKVAE